jgi:hypothetical protein
MAWNTTGRGTFLSLPPKLPERVQPLADEFARFEAEASELRRKAEQMRARRAKVAREYEAALAEAMVAKKKTLPISPMPDYDAAVEDVDHRAAAAFRAAATVYARIGQALGQSKAEDTVALAAELDGQLSRAEAMLGELAPLLDETTLTLALLRWHSWLDPNRASNFKPASKERKTMDQAVAGVVSVLRQLRASLDRQEAPPEPAEEEVA